MLAVTFPTDRKNLPFDRRSAPEKGARVHFIPDLKVGVFVTLRAPNVIKIRGVMARKGDTPEYVGRMQQELFNCFAEARSRDELRRIEPKAQGIY